MADAAAGAAAAPAAVGEAARRFLERAGRLLVGGEWVPAADGAVFATVDPATERVIGEIAHGGPADVDAAVAAARAAFEGEWSRLPAATRSLLLHRLADLIEEHGNELAELETLDNGMPLRVARESAIPATVAHYRYFAGWPTKIEGETIPVTRPDTLCYTRPEPVGVCAQIIPWNFPLLMAAWKLAPALAAGCTLVLKPAEQTPLTALRLGELVLEAGFPEGVVNVVTGDGATGAALVAHPGIDKVAFTGSLEVGREVAAVAGRALKRVTLELGGKSPNVILPDARLDAAVPAAFSAITFLSGQACQAGSRLFVHSSHADEVVARLAEHARETTVGPGFDNASRLGPLVSSEQLARVRGYIESGLADGAELAVGGGDGGNGAGYFVEPTVFVGAADETAIAREEIFGPVLVVLPFDDLDEVVRRANATEYGLAAGVWTSDLGTAHTLAARFRAGSVYINCWGASDPAGPFGGFKSSGIGRERGRANLDAYLELKTVWTSLA